MNQTYQQISEKYNISYSKLTDRVRFLGIKGRFKNKKMTFNKIQVEEIVNFTTAGSARIAYNRNHPKKFKIIEFYQKGRSARKVAEFLNIDRKFVYSTIREYNETDCIVVASKMNNNQN